MYRALMIQPLISSHSRFALRRHIQPIQHHAHSFGNNHRMFSNSRSMGSHRGGNRETGQQDHNAWESWPIQKTNTLFNIVPHGHKFVVERFGKLHSIKDSGFFFAIPFIDQIAYVVDLRERAMDISPQTAITKDNVSVEVSGNLFIKFQDPESAAYGALNPLYNVTQHSHSAMRSAIGEMELDEILHGRARLNALIKGSLEEAAIPWGLEIRRYEITEITPDDEIRIAMDKQAAAERDRREHVLRAEGDKQQTQLVSEGVKISMKNESEGTLIKIQNEAEAAKQKILLEAQGQAEAVRMMANAQAEALQMIAAELNKAGGDGAARLALARDYITMYGEMGQKSNTIMFNDRPADVNSLLSQAVLAMNATTNATLSTGTSNSKLEATALNVGDDVALQHTAEAPLEEESSFLKDKIAKFEKGGTCNKFSPTGQREDFVKNEDEEKAETDTDDDFWEEIFEEDEEEEEDTKTHIVGYDLNGRAIKNNEYKPKS